MTGRTRAREVALQLLYGKDLNPLLDSDPIEAFINGRLADPRLRSFTRDLIAGVHTKRPQLDQLISEIAENWKIERMSPIDRNVLRLCAFELLFTDVPPKAAIDEAIKVQGGQITSSPGPMPMPANAASLAAVPEDSASTYFLPRRSPKASSNCVTGLSSPIPRPAD